MSKVQIDLGEVSGGGKINPLVMTYRAAGSGFASNGLPQFILRCDLINSYKYIKLMTTQEFQTYSGRTDLGNCTSSGIDLVETVPSTGAVVQTVSISNTPTDLSSSSFSDSDVAIIQTTNRVSGTIMFAVMLYDE